MKRKEIGRKMSRMFRELEKGDRVGINIDVTEKIGFPKRLQGKTGIIEERRGKAYIVKIIDGSKAKRYIIKPIHLKKLNFKKV